MHLHARRIALLAVLAVTASASSAGAAAPGSTLLVSRPDGLGPLVPAGDNHAAAGTHALSGDGRFVVYAGRADDLGARDGHQHVWLRDTMTGSTTLVDRGPGGAPGDGDAGTPSISRDGSAVCFSSLAGNLVAGVGPIVGPGFSQAHTYVVRLATGAILVADRAAGAEGAVGDKGVFDCLLDADASRVAFSSEATNLVGGDTNGNFDVFVRDLSNSTTQRVSVVGGGAGTQVAGGGGLESLSGDGTRIAFGTRASLLAGDTNMSAFDIYVRDTTAGTTFLASVGTGGVPGDGDSFSASLDDSGTMMAFVSDSTNFGFGDMNNTTDAFVRFLGADETVLVSRATGPAGAIGDKRSPEATISGDGLGVAFVSEATNLGATPPPNEAVVYLRKLSGATTEAVSRAGGAGGALDTRRPVAPSLATTPSVVTWGSNSITFGLGTPGDFDTALGRGDFDEVFRRDLTGDEPTEVVSQPTGSAPRNSGVNDSELRAGSVSADGRFVVFTSRSDGLDPAGAGRVVQAYVRDNFKNTTTLVSRAAGDGPAANFGVRPGTVISADGSRVAFISNATNLVQGVGGANVYVRTLATGELRIASRGDGPEGGPLSGFTIDFSSGAALSRDGTRVAFTTRTKLTAGDTDTGEDVFVRDLNAGTTTLVSVDSGTSSVAALDPSISADGNRVAFTSGSTLLVLGGPMDGGDHIFVRDLAAGTTVVADRRDGQETFGVLSGDPVLSDDGNRVVFRTLTALSDDTAPQGGVYVRDLAAARTFLASRADGVAGASAQVPFDPGAAISGDGRIVTFAAFGLPGAADEAHEQVFRRDLAAGTTTLVSAPSGSAGALPESHALYSALDANGGCVGFVATGNGLAVPDHATVDFQQVYMRASAGECPRLTLLLAEVPTAGQGDKDPPVLSKVSMSPTRFAVGRSITALSAARRPPPTGTRFRFTVSESSTVRIAIARRIGGRRSGKRCVKPTPKLRKRAACTRVVGAVTVRRRVAAGRRSVTFSGRWARRRALVPGRYQATLRATDVAGNISAPKLVRFTVVRR